jgi:mRNA interferase YafQ
VARRRPRKAVPAVVEPPPPLILRAMTRFERDVGRMRKRGEDMEKFTAVVEALASRRPLPAALKDHPLRGDWQGWRDCHVAPDWIIIYRTTAEELILARTGTHADLFE